MTGSERPAPPEFRVPEHDASGETRHTRERTPLRVLIVEDSENDVLLLLSELRRGGYEPLHEWVETPEKMEEALGRGPWDVVVADQGMPRFGATQVLALLREKGLDLPFVLVSGKIGEDEARYRSIFENAAEGIFRSTADGRLRAANPALAHILGYASADELVSSVSDIGRLIPADPTRREEFAEQMRSHGVVVGFEARVLRKDGALSGARWTSAPTTTRRARW